MKCSLLMSLVPLVLIGCAADPMPTDSDESVPALSEVNANEADPQARVGRALDDSKYCLPGEVVHCTLGPPPVCSCVPKPVATSVFVAR